MESFTYERADTATQAAMAAAPSKAPGLFPGGTNLLDLMKLEIETPAHLIDMNRLALDKIETTPGAVLHAPHDRRPSAQSKA